MKTATYQIDTVEVSSSSLLVPTIRIQGFADFFCKPFFFILGIRSQHRA